MPYPTITIISGGQLGRMMTQEAQKLGFEVTILDKDPGCSAGQVADNLVIGTIFDKVLIQELALKTDFWTFEVEHLDCDQLERINSRFDLELNPGIQSLRTINDKLTQKYFLKKMHIPVADFASFQDLDTLEFPFMLKTRRGGFDGRGNKIVKNIEELNTWLINFGNGNCYGEKLVKFTKEISVIVVKGKFETSLYEVTENIHVNNICHRTITPARISDSTQKNAQEIALKIVENLEGFGCFTVEFFVLQNDELVVNEIAPRVHNSGHWTQNGSETCQFQNHIRAITGLHLGSTAMTHQYCVMLNILGSREGEVDLQNLHQLLELQNLHLHLYGKTPVKVERKMGHINLVGDDLDSLLVQADEIAKQVII
jgi:5-(carboxyamino)imidazole ribonucleotide synthase